MAWYDRCKEHCDSKEDYSKNAKLDYHHRDDHGKNTHYMSCEVCGKTWAEN